MGGGAGAVTGGPKRPHDEGQTSVSESRSGAADCCDAAVNEAAVGDAANEAAADAAESNGAEAKPDDDAAVSLEVGQRLRMIRRAQGLSLADVEARSQGRWSASAVGAYERGFRNLSVPRLKALADFFGVTPAALLGDTDETHGPSGGALVFDTVALRTRFPDAAVTRFVEAIIRQRGDFNGRVLSVRHDDVQAVLAMVDPDPATAMGQLRRMDVLFERDAARGPESGVEFDGDERGPQRS